MSSPSKFRITSIWKIRRFIRDFRLQAEELHAVCERPLDRRVLKLRIAAAPIDLRHPFRSLTQFADQWRNGPFGADCSYRGAMRRAADILAARTAQGFSLVSQIANLYTYAGDKAQALDWLEKAFEIREPNLPNISADPKFDGLRSEPRFQALLRRMNLPQ